MTSIEPDATVVAGENHLETTVSGETVLLNREAGTYQGLSGVGPRIWELIQEPTTVATVVESIAQEYDVDADRCDRDVRSFLQELVDEGLVEIDDRQPA